MVREPDRPESIPVVDGRRREDVLRYISETAPYYTDRWSPEANDAGLAVARLFAEMVEDVTERVDLLPEKHFTAFLKTVGFDRNPPQSARLPLTAELVDGVDQNVPVPVGTQVVAPATESTPESTFEIGPGDEFEATPATLVGAYSSYPRYDQLFEHLSALAEGRETTLFGGENVQSHTLYLGHADLLDVKAGATVRIRFEFSDASDAALMRRLRDELQWWYYGDEDGEEGWHPMSSVSVETEPRVSTTAKDRPSRPIDRLSVVEEPSRVDETVRAFLVEFDAKLSEEGYEPVTLSAEAKATLRQRITADAYAGRLALSEYVPAVGVADVSVVKSVTDKLRKVGRKAYGEFARERDGPTDDVLTLELDGTPVEWAVGGVESRWLCARFPATAPRRFDFAFETVTMNVRPPGPDGDGAVDALFADDVPLPTSGSDEGPIRPFGELPQRYNTFYVASDDAFTKRDSMVTLRFDGGVFPTETLENSTENPVSLTPTLSWEFWDGNGWARLNLNDPTDQNARLLKAGKKDTVEVSFTVPDDLEPTTVMGQEFHWIRVRLVAGDYGEVYYQDVGGRWEQMTNRVYPPTFTGVTVSFGEDPVPKTIPDHVQTENSLEVETVSTDKTKGVVRPFRPLTDETQTVYLAFDRPVVGGPIHLFVSPTDRAYPTDFYPRIRWEYCVDPADDRWESVSAVDGSEGFTERGIVRLVIPTATDASERFGLTAHWLRARVAGTEFIEQLMKQTTRCAQSTSDRSGASSCRVTVSTSPPTGTASKRPPTLTGLYPNTTWASNVRTVTAERLGVSDGTRSQSFTVGSPPLVDATVWVDEGATLSEEALQTLEDTASEGTEIAVEVDRGPAGEQRRVWVRWTAVDDFLDSGPSDRHFGLDRTAGTVTFGDGVAGRIPPAGAVRSTYRTGGGTAGNVPAGAVTSLESSIPFVAGVTNPEPGDGGADAETSESVLARGPAELRDRNRAVAAADFERLALAVSRKVARCKCVPALDANGVFCPGWVTVLIVPQAATPDPSPTAELRAQVEASLAKRAAATLVDSGRLVVRGPSYVAVGVETTVVTTAGTSVSTVEAATTDAVMSFLHPLTGGPTGEGWPFGELPCPADFYSLLEQEPNIDHVASLTVRFYGSDRIVRAVEGEEAPTVSTDALVTAGRIDVSAIGGK